MANVIFTAPCATPVVGVACDTKQKTIGRRGAFQPLPGVLGQTIQFPHRASTLAAGNRLKRQSRTQQPEGSSNVSFSGSRHMVVCGAGVSHPGEEKEGSGVFNAMISVPTTGMAKGFGSFGGATMEKSKLSNKQELKQTAPKVDDSGGGGGTGNRIFNGGGGDGDDGDDDDYFEEFGDGDGDGGDEGFFRAALAQLYDPKTINAVMQEWYRTVADLPLILRQAVAMGLFSSAQLVRFMALDVRPSVTRTMARSLPPQVASGLVGRMMADPAFVQKVLVEQLITVGGSLFWEMRQRGDKFKNELDLVAVNTLSLAAANLALVWLVSPSRAYGTPFKFAWQSMLQKLPNNVFDASGPQRVYTTSSRVAGFVAKAAELCTVGTLAGVSMSGLSSAAVALRRRSDPNFQPSVPIPDMRRSAGGLALSMGLFANLRYQMIGGIDRYFFEHSTQLWSYMTTSSVFRVISNRFDEATRLHLQNLPTEAPRSTQLRQLAVAKATAQPKRVRKVKKVRKVKRVSGGFEMSAGVPAA